MFVDFNTQQFAETSAFRLRASNNSSRLHATLKRSFDILFSLVALICLAPLFLVIACLLIFYCRGPVFFKQTRNGKAGKTFSIYKFRSMKHIPSEKFTQCEVNDNRVTKIGQFIRKTSIDELPQLINVLLGQMSIVGPRPHPVELDAKYESSIPAYMDRYAVKPGLTGLAQIRGHRGLTPNVVTMAKRVNADLEYAKRVTVVRDLAIIAKTIPAVLRRNAH
jgi:putative colanic acid biosysnthesis UDP-glucose lipid carrier transferase